MVVGRLLERTGYGVPDVRNHDLDQVHVGIAAVHAPERAVIEAQTSAEAANWPFERIMVDGQRHRPRS